MNIALTGATGFIGSNLIDKLKKTKSANIFVFDKNKNSLFDILSLKDFVREMDVIIHLAGIKSSNNPSLIYQTNLLGSANLLRAITLYGKKQPHFIFPSTFLVYGDNSLKIPLRETSTLLPLTDYGISKLLAEESIKTYGQIFNIKISILRIANVYGPELHRKSNSVPNLFINGINNNNPILIKGDGQIKRDLIYIDDVCEAFIKAIKNQKKSALTLNICTGRAVKMIDLVKIIEKELHKKALLEFDKKYHENAYWIGNSGKAAKEIKFKASIDIKIGIKKTINGK